MKRKLLYTSLPAVKDPYKEMQNSLKIKMLLLIIIIIALLYCLWTEGEFDFLFN